LPAHGAHDDSRTLFVASCLLRKCPSKAGSFRLKPEDFLLFGLFVFFVTPGRQARVCSVVASWRRAVVIAAEGGLRRRRRGEAEEEEDPRLSRVLIRVQIGLAA